MPNAQSHQPFIPPPCNIPNPPLPKPIPFPFQLHVRQAAMQRFPNPKSTHIMLPIKATQHRLLHEIRIPMLPHQQTQPLRDPPPKQPRQRRPFPKHRRRRPAPRKHRPKPQLPLRKIRPLPEVRPALLRNIPRPPKPGARKDDITPLLRHDLKFVHQAKSSPKRSQPKNYLTQIYKAPRLRHQQNLTQHLPPKKIPPESRQAYLQGGNE
jgi:hypothetical protein